VIANLNNDIIGNSCGSDRHCDAAHVRVFSEGPRWQGREALAHSKGASAGRMTARRETSPATSPILPRTRTRPRCPADLAQRPLRPGGDHTELLNAGYPAVRLSVAVENYDHQHRTEGRERHRIWRHDRQDGLSVPAQGDAAERRGACGAGADPGGSCAQRGGGRVDGYESHLGRRARSGGLPGPLAPHRRRKLAAEPPHRRQRVPRTNPDGQGAGNSPPPRNGCLAVLRGIRVDDYVFGVSSVSVDGYESPVASAVPGGAFRPYTPPPAQP
jgi:hypothetical protein